MLTPGKYFPGTTMAVTAAFTNANGIPSDPATVIFKTYAPCGRVAQYTYGTDGNVSKSSTGNYAATFVADRAGRWRTRWEGTDALGNTIVIEGSFNVQASRFVDHDCCCRDYR